MVSGGFYSYHFELTVLFSALVSVGTLIFICCGLPKVDPPVISKDLTCHKLALFVSKKDKNYSEEAITKLFKEWKVQEFYETRF